MTFIIRFAHVSLAETGLIGFYCMSHLIVAVQLSDVNLVDPRNVYLIPVRDGFISGREFSE